MARKKTLTINAALNTTKTVLGIIFPLITYPYVSRILGVENLGIYNFSLSFLSYFLLIAGLGVAPYGIREGTQYRENKDAIAEFVSELFSINIISTVLTYLLLFAFLYYIPFLANYNTPILILSIEIICTTVGVSWVCNIYEDFFVIALRTILFQIISLLLIFILVKSSADLYKYLTVVVISNSGANFFNFIYIRKKYCKFRFTLKINWQRHLKPVLTIFFTLVAMTIYVSSDMIMLGYMLNNYNVGIYSTAVKVYLVVKNILNSITMVLIPRFSLLLSQSTTENVDILFSKVFNIMTLIMLPVCVLLCVLSDDVVFIVSGVNFMKASQPLKYLSLALFFSIYAYLCTQCILIPAKREDIVFKAAVLSAIVNVLLNFFLIPELGINGAAITTVIAEAVIFMMTFLQAKNIIGSIDVRKNSLSVLSGCLCIYIVCTFMHTVNNLFLRLICSVITSLFVYIVILLVMRNSVILQIFNKNSVFK